jgi:hypothetical protein
MSDRVEAEGEDANRFLAGLRGILRVSKAELDAQVVAQKRKRARKRKLRERKVNSDA